MMSEAESQEWVNRSVQNEQNATKTYVALVAERAKTSRYEAALKKIADPNFNRWYVPADQVRVLREIAAAALAD